MTHTTPAPPVFDPARIKPLTEAQLWQLMQFLSDDRVKQLKGMSYVEAWDVKATLTRVFGFGGFSTQILSEEMLFKEQVAKSSGNGTNWSIAYKVSLRLIIPQLGAFFDEAAVGSNAQGSVAEALDNAVKGATSDALKRCATMLGTQFGLGLYDNGNQQEIIRRIVAPGQEWDVSKGGRVIPGAKREEPKQPEERPASAGAATVRPYGTTEEEHSANVDLLNQALSAKKKQQEQQGHRAGYDVPVALDPSIDTAPDNRGLIDNVDGAVIDDELRAKAARSS